jgi:hypothetical protein
MYQPDGPEEIAGLKTPMPSNPPVGQMGSPSSGKHVKNDIYKGNY